MKRRTGWLLLALDAAGGEALSPVQLQKALFLLGQKLPDDVGHSYYKFVPYHYGPFDVNVYRDADSLAEQGLVSVTQPTSGRWNEYIIMPNGTAHAAGLKQQRPQRAVEYLGALVDWVRSLSFDQLVRFIYRAYPEYRVNSVFRG